ncbi:MAG: cadherin repeat domain-containing protein, partial [Betaproteobacteria bacterium]|nr:cadherin repeat domain-containing protein [Betaproteobacteria bacterium]
TLAADATAATLTGLTAGTSYDITLNWLSADERLSATAATTSGSTDAAAPGGMIAVDRPNPLQLDAVNQAVVISVELDSAPTGAGNGGVTLGLTSADDTEVQIAPAQLIFTRSNWNIAQRVTVELASGAADTKTSRNVNVNIAVSNGSGTENYASGVPAVVIGAVLDLLNRAPVFTADERTRSIDEGDYEANAAIGDPIAADDVDNPAGDLTHSLVGTSQLFAVSSAGQLSFKAATTLDRETTASYEVTLKVDDGESANIGRATVTVAIMVDNVNEAPVFASETYRRVIDENEGKANVTAVGENVGAVIAVADPEGDTVTYELDPVSDIFQVTKVSNTRARIKVKAATHFNHEKTSTYTLTLKATDDASPPLSQVQEVIISLNDLVETPAAYANASLTVTGSTASEITLGWNNVEYKAQFEDEDRASIVIRYGDGGGGSAQLGTLVVADVDATSAVLRGLRANKVHRITLRFYSQDGSFSTRTIRHRNPAASATNANPTFSASSLRANKRENAGSEQTPTSETLGTVVGQDTDTQDTLTYSITGGDRGFGIDESSGAITVLTATNFDHETKGKYTINVAVSDGNGGSALGMFVLSVTDINEAPVFVGGDSVTRVLAENQPSSDVTAVNAAVGRPVRANDPDEENRRAISNRFDYSLQDANSLFKISRRGGQIQVAAETHFNHERQDVYTVTVVATDQGRPPRAANQEVIITLTDVPETPDDYTAHSFNVDGQTDDQITLSWNNN